MSNLPVPNVTREKWITQDAEIANLRAEVARLTAERDAANPRDDYLLAYNLAQYRRGNQYRNRALALAGRLREMHQLCLCRGTEDCGRWKP